MRRSATETIRSLETRIARLERQSFRFPRKPKPNTLTLVESESGFHQFQVSGKANITTEDIVGVALRVLGYSPSSQWYAQELDGEARRYSDGEYTDFGTYEYDFNKLFTKIIKKQVLVSRTRSGDKIIVSYNPQGLYRNLRLIYSEGLHFLLNRKTMKAGAKVVSQLLDDAIRSLGSESRVARLERKSSYPIFFDFYMIEKTYQCFNEVFKSISKHLSFFRIEANLPRVPKERKKDAVSQLRGDLAVGERQIYSYTYITRVRLISFEDAPVFKISFESYRGNGPSRFVDYEIIGEKGSIDRQVKKIQESMSTQPGFITKMASQKDFIEKWNRSGNYSDLEKAGLADAYDELYSLTVKEEERGDLSSRENKRYVDLYEMLTKHKVEIRFGVNI